MFKNNYGIFWGFTAKNNRGNVKTLCITFIHSFNMISISADIFKAEQIPGGFARI